jgi:hypothetical protein
MSTPDYWDKKVKVDKLVKGHRLSKKAKKKAERKAIMERHGSVNAADVYTDEQWSRLMWAGHSEVNEVMREISVENGLIAHYRSQKMSFEEWLNANEEEVTIYAAETGADRELDYDREKLEERLYEEYLNDSKQN